MLFVIDEECLTALDAKTEDAVAALEMLALNRRKCRNLIYAPKSVLEDLMKRTCFSDIVKKTFQALFNRSVEIKLYFNAVNRYVKIVSEITGERVSIIDGKEECKITLKELAECDVSNYTALITENLDDGRLYKLMGRYYEFENGLYRIPVEFEDKMGGGDTTAKLLELEVEKHERMCLCIVDSDKRFRDDTHGVTMQKIEQFCEGKKQDIWKVILLDVHEIENLLPIYWMKNASQDIEHASKTISFFNYLVSKHTDNNQPLFFFDIKEGIKRERFICIDTQNPDRVKQYRKSENYRKYWRKYIEEYGIIIEDVSDIHIVNGVSKNILSKVLNIYEGEASFDDIEEYLVPKWRDIGKEIFDWGCVGNRIAI